MRGMEKINVALLLGNMSLLAWQQHALEQCKDIANISLVLDCTNSPPHAKNRGHSMFNLLERLTTPAQARRRVKCASGPAATIHFECEQTGAATRLPAHVIAALAKSSADVLIDLGLPGLQDLSAQVTRFGVLTYAFGAPEKYLGAPNGFHEVWNFDPTLDICVQRLTADTDCTDVIARTQAPVIHHSYEQTLEIAYAMAVPVLREALTQLSEQRQPKPFVRGPFYAMPSNTHVLLFLRSLAIRKIRRLSGR